MRIRNLFNPRPPRRSPSLPPAPNAEAGAGLSLRDWADLPTHHPRHDSDAR